MLTNPVDFADHLGPNPGGQTPAGRFVLTQSISRGLGPGAAGGFPRYVIEWSDRDVNEAEQLTPDTNPGEALQAWWSAGPLTQGPPISGLVSNFADWHRLGEVNFTPGNWPAGDPPFQLFVPNGPLLHNSELHMLSAFSHMYAHENFMDNFLDPGGPRLQIEDYPSVGSRWLTVSEQLGMQAHAFYDAEGGGVPNPYYGVLDPSRFIVNSDDMGSLSRVPDTLAVPLATRVFDAFETMPGEARDRRLGSDDTPANGRINVNTAPRRVLELLPFVDPRDPTVRVPGAPAMTINGWTPADGVTRVDDMLTYRSRNLSRATGGAATPPAVDLAAAAADQARQLTALEGLRLPQSEWAPGFATTGELAVLGVWTGGGGIGTPASFLELGVDGPSDGAPLETRADDAADWFRDGGGGDQSLDPFYADPLYNPVDDPEERLAIFRAISNIVSTRSDVFTAWFIVRGYRASDIESIEFDEQLGSDAQRVELMNPGAALSDDPGAGEQETSPGLLPAFEERWLAVFDRSNVRSPTDRPRVLLMVQLPID